MIFQISKTIVLAVSALLMMLTGCTQTPNYAPVKTVNQAIEPNNGYYFRKKTPIKPLNNPYKLQETAKSTLYGQQNNSIRQPSTINGLPYPSPYQNKPSQKYSIASAGVVRSSITSDTEIFNPNKVSQKPNPLSYKVELPTKYKPAHSRVVTNPALQQQKSPTKGDSKNKLILSETNNIAMLKKPDIIVVQPTSPQPVQKNNNERKSIISIDNKKMLKLNFQWPIQGKISRNFAQTDNKGIDITGRIGQAVQAAESGKAVYCGRGLVNFGNLVIIKHKENYLTAYANNSQLYIKEGQQVEKGQTIGQVGATGLKKASVHFEIRKNGKSINPLTLLPKH
jgi:lipoprotein NlpD